MFLIDIHTHIYPNDIASKAANSIRNFYQIGQDGEMDGTVDMLLHRGKTAGISKFVVLPVAIRPDRVRGINDFILEQTKLHKEFVEANRGVAEKVLFESTDRKGMMEGYTGNYIRVSREFDPGLIGKIVDVVL